MIFIDKEGKFHVVDGERKIPLPMNFIQLDPVAAAEKGVVHTLFGGEFAVEQPDGRVLLGNGRKGDAYFRTESGRQGVISKSQMDSIDSWEVVYCPAPKV